VPGLCSPYPLRLRHPEPMPQVLDIRHLPGFKERQPMIPPGAVYIGRANARYRLPASKWANPFSIRQEADREAAIASYERWLRLQRHLIDALHELHERDLVCWCAPLPWRCAAAAGQRVCLPDVAAQHVD
jgi:hypothetical protein